MFNWITVVRTTKTSVSKSMHCFYCCSTLFWFLSYLIHKQWFKMIQVVFLPVGHTHEKVENILVEFWMFRLIETSLPLLERQKGWWTAQLWWPLKSLWSVLSAKFLKIQSRSVNVTLSFGTGRNISVHIVGRCTTSNKIAPFSFFITKNWNVLSCNINQM